MYNNICPAVILAANLNPNEICLAIYDINSIKTKSGNKLKEQPEGTNIEKNFNPFV